MFASKRRVFSACAWGTADLLSDGDPVSPLRKVERSGLSAAVNGNVMIYVHNRREVPRLRGGG
jgi:hypothetical protein